jgi:F-type H+-transporting ATPase subunit alpha
MDVADQVVAVYAATNGYLDRVAVEKVSDFLEGLMQRLHSEAKDVRETIDGGDWSDDTIAKVKKVVDDFADDFGYDLDEEGQPLSDDAPLEPRRSAASDSGDDADASADDGDDGDGEESSDDAEKEPATA